MASRWESSSGDSSNRGFWRSGWLRDFELAVRHAVDAYAVDAAFGDFEDVDLDLVLPGDLFTPYGDASEFGEDEAADGVEVAVVGQVEVHGGVDFVDVRAAESFDRIVIDLFNFFDQV